MPFVTANDGVPLHYASAGSGQALVLVHGWTMNGRFFRKNVQELAERYHVITIDSRGHGYSGKELIHLTLEQLAQDVETVLAALNLDNVVLAGWSMGMGTVYNYLNQFGTRRLAGVISIDMSPFPFVEDEWPHGVYGSLTPAASLAVQREIVRDRAALLPSMIPAMFAAGGTPDPADLTWWSDESAAVPDLTALALWVSFSSQDWRPLLARIDVPVLLVHGLKSQAYPTPVWEYLANKIPEARVELFEESGHSPFWEEPDRFNAAVRAFIESLP